MRWYVEYPTSWSNSTATSLFSLLHLPFFFSLSLSSPLACRARYTRHSSQSPSIWYSRGRPAILLVEQFHLDLIFRDRRWWIILLSLIVIIKRLDELDGRRLAPELVSKTDDITQCVLINPSIMSVWMHTLSISRSQSKEWWGRKEVVLQRND